MLLRFYAFRGKKALVNQVFFRWCQRGDCIFTFRSLKTALKAQICPVREVIIIADYMTADSGLPLYIPYPRFLLELDLTQTAKLIYAVLLDRDTLSQTNDWTDEDRRLFIVFPIAGIANTIDRSPMTVKNALNELETAGLIERRHGGFALPNRIYVKIPDGQDIVRLMDKNLSSIGKENCPYDGQKIVH